MRWSLLGIAALLGALSLSLLGGGTACVVGDDAGAGGTAAETSSSTGIATCDSASQGNCELCKTCAAQGACLTQLTACGNDPICVAVSTCMEGCVETQIPPAADCVASCCAMDPTGVALYVAAAQCTYAFQCPFSCYGYPAVCPTE